MSTHEYLQIIMFFLVFAVFLLAVITGALLAISGNLRRWRTEDRNSRWRTEDRST